MLSSLGFFFAIQSGWRCLGKVWSFLLSGLSSFFLLQPSKHTVCVCLEWKVPCIWKSKWNRCCQIGLSLFVLCSAPKGFFFSISCNFSTRFIEVYTLTTWTVNKKEVMMIIVIITGSSFKLKRQENETEFELDSNETIVSVTAGENISFLMSSKRTEMCIQLEESSLHPPVWQFDICLKHSSIVGKTVNSTFRRQWWFCGCFIK